MSLSVPYHSKTDPIPGSSAAKHWCSPEVTRKANCPSSALPWWRWSWKTKGRFLAIYSITPKNPSKSQMHFHVQGTITQNQHLRCLLIWLINHIWDIPSACLSGDRIPWDPTGQLASSFTSERKTANNHY